MLVVKNGRWVKKVQRDKNKMLSKQKKGSQKNSAHCRQALCGGTNESGTREWHGCIPLT